MWRPVLTPAPRFTGISVPAAREGAVALVASVASRWWIDWPTRELVLDACPAAAPISGRKRFSACFAACASQVSRAPKGLPLGLWRPRACSSVSRLADGEPLPPMAWRAGRHPVNHSIKGIMRRIARRLATHDRADTERAAALGHLALLLLLLGAHVGGVLCRDEIGHIVWLRDSERPKRLLLLTPGGRPRRNGKQIYESPKRPPNPVPAVPPAVPCHRRLVTTILARFALCISFISPHRIASPRIACTGTRTDRRHRLPSLSLFSPPLPLSDAPKLRLVTVTSLAAIRSVSCTRCPRLWKSQTYRPFSPASFGNDYLACIPAETPRH